MIDDDLGCVKCNITPSKGVSFEDLPWETERMLYDDRRHYDFRLQRCIYCGTPWLHNFKEIVDWGGGGNDDMYNSWMPLTAAEQAEIEQLCPVQREYEVLPELEKFLGRRRTLVMGPKGEFACEGPGPQGRHIQPPG